MVCNPPWVPAKPSSAIEHAVYDPDSRMLRGFLAGLAAHLEAGGEGWLILSDLAEHFGLRTRAELLDWIGALASDGVGGPGAGREVSHIGTLLKRTQDLLKFKGVRRATRF